MHEAAFIKKNKEKWQLFEDVIRNNKEISPNKLSDLYIEVTEDLSYAATFYPESNIVVYLNSIAAESHRKIYKTKKESKKRLIDFYRYDFPIMFYQYQKQLLIAFSVFAFFTLVGMYSSYADIDFVRLILGDGYVNMTLDNIDNNDPMAVYKDKNKMDMFLGITINNIRVALLAFAFGMFFTVGSIYIMMKNGIMLGSFLYFFIDKDLMWESFRTIWIHGTIEISVIIIAGCAGMVMGNSILFPKTYSRLESFKKGAKDGVTIVLSTVPFFILAGFLEGYVTRHTEMPDWLAIMIIGVSLFMVIFYYVYYPIKLNKELKNKNHDAAL
ncbi:stage II sporulation protein M [Aureivirga sp. CE67]|uniref:stage II sporulation protein M n=1 Tax=Aureivirga sp. CE67 TaxID=1788983 RepID=UPI0018CA039C|nr:stage II sporulation protein M [Aureivirga sp. CE67]